jgi:hypothetical protein
MRRLFLSIVFITLFICTPSFAGMYDLALHASRSDLEARFNATLPLEKGAVSTGLGAIYRDTGYRIADMKLTLGRELLAPGLRLNLGLKGVAGNVERDQREGDLMAVGILVSGRYPLPETISPFPIAVSALVSFAPEPLCFSDSERYLGLRASLDFPVVESGAILFGYRHIRARLHDSHGQWNMTDAVFFVGYRLRY